MINQLKNFVKIRTRDAAQYTIGYRKIKGLCLYDGNYDGQFRTMRPTLRYWFADPIVNYIKGTEYIFCEMYDKFRQKGVIGICYKDKNGGWRRPKKIIGGERNDQHLSFPVIAKWKESYYMFPCIGNGVIQVYKMGRNERSWHLWQELFDDKCYVDPVFAVSDNRLYMLSGILDKENGHNTRLSINEIVNLEVKNQMKIKSALYESVTYENTSRNGGKLLKIKKDGLAKVLRVTQESDDINGYGHNLQFRETSYENGQYDEKLYYRLEKECLKTDIDYSIWMDIIGPHTYSRTKDTEIIDIKIRAFCPVYILRYLRDNIKILFAGERKRENG